MNSAKHFSLTNLSENSTLLKKVLDLSVKGLMIVDKFGVLIFITESFAKIHNVKVEDAIGKHVRDVIENTRMHIVAQTGIAEQDELQQIHGHEYVVSRIPIIENGVCLGAIGIIRFEYTAEVKELQRKVLKLESELKNKTHNLLINTDTNYSFTDIVAISEPSINAKNIALRAAACDSTVLLLGESGVGKEVFAQSIHNLSKRNHCPFIRLNCSAIQDTLFESELFGYEDGAFTGAKKGGKKGKFELAQSGTILLDEIGDMPLSVQSKLSRVIQEREIDKVGGERVKNIDVRIIAATNCNLEELIAEGKFRQDLFYRLDVIPIYIPPLRERRLDIPLLIKAFWERLQKERGVYYKNLSPQAQEVLISYKWPGNIRELKNVLERAITIVPQDIITDDHIKTIIQGHSSKKSEFFLINNYNLTDLLSNTEKEAISVALVRSSNNRSHTAKLLGISRSLLYKKMHQYNLC